MGITVGSMPYEAAMILEEKMDYRLSAACGSNVGRIRGNNEDSFYFNGYIPDSGSDGIVSLKDSGIDGTCFCVFDGMGGEEHGDIASFTAASALETALNGPDGNILLEDLCSVMNDAVCARAQELCSGRMGTTMAMLCFSLGKAFVCNIGDSRIYLFRDDKLRQLSEDHVEELPPGRRWRKPGLTQYIGIPKDELLIEPHTAAYDIQKNDVFLICSDGLTDMLTEEEICSCIKNHLSAEKIVDDLIIRANRSGGRDNITALIAKVQ